MPEQNQSLTGKTVLITGGARRVGAAIARELHAAGANLAIHYRKSAGDAEALAAGAQRRRAGFGRDGAGRPAGSRAPAGAGRIRGAQLRRPRRAREQRVDLLRHQGRGDHPGGVGRSDGHQSQGADVSVAGRGAGAAQVQRTDPQHRRHPRAAPAAQLHRVLHGQGRAAHAHAFAGQGTRTRNPGQWHLARPVLWPEGAGRRSHARQDHRAHHSQAHGNAGRHRAHRAVLRRAGAVHHRARCWRWTAAAASPGRQRARLQPAPGSSITTGVIACPSRSKAFHNSPMVRCSVGCTTSGAISASGPSM